MLVTDARSLEDYLKRFDVTVALLQTPGAIERVAYEPSRNKTGVVALYRRTSIWLEVFWSETTKPPAVTVRAPTRARSPSKCQGHWSRL